MLTARLYQSMLDLGKSDEVSDIIDKMSHAERIDLRDKLTKIGENRQMRNLYYDYETQVWIEPELVLAK